MTLLTQLVTQGSQIMAQVDDLKAILTDVSGKIDGVGTEVADLIAKLEAANQNPNVDLTEVISMAQAIQTKLAAIPPEPGATA